MSLKDHVATIMTNWHLEKATDCIPPPLWPGQYFPQWGADIIMLLSQISSTRGATLPDFTTKLREAVKLRQQKNKSATGRTSRVKPIDLKAVLKQYEREAETTGAGAASPVSNAKERNGGRTTRNTRIQVPKTPVNHDDEDEEEEEEGSSEPLAGGKYQYLNGVRPVKVDLNPDASAVKKPTRPKPPPRGKRRKANEAANPGPQVVELPTLVHQDPDPRVPDDTGFLSDLEGNEVKEKGKKRKKRLSRLEQQRIREPHWQLDNDNITLEVLTPTRPLDAPGVEDEDEAVSLLKSLPNLPANATATEKRELEELKLSMEQRIWRIKVLRIEERVQNEGLGRREEKGEEEQSGDSEENAGRGGRLSRIEEPAQDKERVRRKGTNGNVEDDTTRGGRVLRTRRGK
ncbi:hypothetical protein BKA58DRAFT_320232 [Alternaria rosae]|uniref:uncharacterized protein n=1 Tax=Alternaria rosae TaxID=1187941 RepID=UPI001E8D839E|nr:uncharacterized protein BKA58DRAFT_320232 [Alternaria rosae]KAH6865447.1 hypothetical protein BKA58DRAFT_320232 [Alternaria rosae]